MLHKNRKMPQDEIDNVYEDFVIEIAAKVAKKVKGKVFYGYANIEDMWYVIIETRELGKKRFFLDTLDYDMMAGVSSKEISAKILKLYHKIVEGRFFIVWVIKRLSNAVKYYNIDID